MKILRLSILFVFIVHILTAQIPRVEWTKSIGGSGNDRANTITTDNEGSIIVAGRFTSNSIKINQLTITKNKKDNEDFSDIFIIKLNPKGNAVWAVSAGNFGDDHALSCTTDNQGNVYAVGYFESDTLSFGNVFVKNKNFSPGLDSTKRYNSDLWVAKFSKDGKCLWAKNAGGLDGNGQYSIIALDKENNVVVGGIAGAEMNFGDGIILKSEKGGMFVAKYSTNGKLLWAKGAEFGECQGVCVDKDNNIIAGGFFREKIAFDDKVKLVAQGKTDAFITKYNSNGEVLWAKNFGGENNEIASAESDIMGNIYLGGLFFSKTINAGNTVLSNNGFINSFIAKYDNSGNLLWAKAAGGNNGDKPGTATREFYVDDEGNVYCTGSNWSEFSFAGKTIKPVSDYEDVFLLKYDKNGNEIWGLDFGGSGRNAGRGVVADGDGNIFLTGSFDEKEMRIENYALKNSGDSDIFIVKFKDSKKSK